MDIWKIKNSIKNGSVKFKSGDIIILFRKKGKNPRRLEFNKDYIIKEVIEDYLTIEVDNLLFKVHKTYMIPKSYIRDMKIESLMNKYFNI